MRFKTACAAMLCLLLSLSTCLLPFAEDFLPEVHEEAIEESALELDFSVPEEASQAEEATLAEETSFVSADGEFFEDFVPTPSPTITPPGFTPTITPSPTPVPERRTSAYVPAVDSTEDGFKVEGFSEAFAFPYDSPVPFTVTGASPMARYGDNLYPQDIMWVPQYWTFDGDYQKHDELSSDMDPALTRTMYLTSTRSADHQVGYHIIQIYFTMYTYNGRSWEPFGGGTVVSPVSVAYAVADAADVTPTPSPTPGPSPTARVGYIPAVDSMADGFKVEGLQDALPLAEGVSHFFTVYGASASEKYGIHLVAGDGKWSPLPWTGTEGALPAEEEERLAIDAKEMTLKSPSGLYGPARNLTIYLHFRLFIFDGTQWVPTETIGTVPQTVKVASITPTPSPTPIPVPTGKVSLNENSLTLYKGAPKAYKKFTLEATLTGDCAGKTVTFTSSKPEIATVSEKGVVTAKKKGSCTVTAKVTVQKKTFKASCRVKVKKPTLTLGLDAIELAVGESEPLTGTAVPEGKLDFSSTNKNIATVTRKGIVTGKKAGTCEIVVTCNNVSKSCRVTVTK